MTVLLRTQLFRSLAHTDRSMALSEALNNQAGDLTRSAMRMMSGYQMPEDIAAARQAIAEATRLLDEYAAETDGDNDDE